ncbi:hypothetical protein CVIRNUC_001416 [Coccomyxa viridis]|uniref:Oxidoreductase FAD/NAD(P)-binding domain-containing protein n=1 Tax=Coccomyxa viridis TaxID=1274662 RepID=A0AAV1HTZ9_9CHLO|nr:hypothetical protein CVIRNUC_001416 [Coccomyxa viridis]
MGPLAKEYTKGGQYFQIKVGDSKPAYYVIASAPATGQPLEVIVKNQGDTAEILCDSKPGAEIDVSPVMGKGFPIEKAPPSKIPYLFIFATGTGVGGIKALIESDALKARERQLTRLYYGTFNPDMTAYKALIPEWEASGVEVKDVYSGFGQGYVQDAFQKDAPITDGEHTGIILCGQPEMGEAVKAIVEKQGVKEDLILTNF